MITSTTRPWGDTRESVTAWCAPSIDGPHTPWPVFSFGDAGQILVLAGLDGNERLRNLATYVDAIAFAADVANEHEDEYPHIISDMAYAEGTATREFYYAVRTRLHPGTST